MKQIRSIDVQIKIEFK